MFTRTQFAPKKRAYAYSQNTRSFIPVFRQLFFSRRHVRVRTVIPGSGHHENLTIFGPMTHDLAACRTVICFQRPAFTRQNRMLQLIKGAKLKPQGATPAARRMPARRVHGLNCISVDDPTLSIVHDLRNPLAAISGCAELIFAGKLDAEQTRRIATNIRRASERMKTLLNAFVSTSMGHNERSELSNLRAVLSAACDAARLSDRPDIWLTMNVAARLELRIHRQRMERVFVNLIVNAMEAMPGGGAIHLTASASANRVRITVEDTGPGIPEVIRDRLFEPFATASKADGVGLGLAISRQSVRAHGGDLWSEPAQGARFVMWLPRYAGASRKEEEPK